MNIETGLVQQLILVMLMIIISSNRPDYIFNQ